MADHAGPHPRQVRCPAIRWTTPDLSGAAARPCPSPPDTHMSHKHYNSRTRLDDAAVAHAIAMRVGQCLRRQASGIGGGEQDLIQWTDGLQQIYSPLGVQLAQHIIQ